MKPFHIFLLLLSVVLSGLAAAEDADPPARVARVSYLQGDVSFQSADGQAPESAVINRPATAGDRILTGRDGRSELTLGIAALRLDEQTDLSISNLDDDIAQFDINSGTVGVHVRELQEHGTFEIDTPNTAIRLLEPGDYRVDVEPSGNVIVSVRNGRAEIDSGNGATEVREGEQAQFANGDRRAGVHSLGRPDSFDSWGEDRERQLNGEQTSRYVSREVVGYEDLDEYGDWRTEPEYGAVWYPRRVVAGWSPYRYGRWAYVSPWGWTWIDNEPWGFAPFHYGRWAHVGARWGWVPGPRHYRPVYAPALVGWVGEPYGGISVSISTGPVGWFPLGPREVYVPYRRVSPRYLRNVNVSNTVIVNNTYITNVSRNRVREIHYANRGVPGAVATMPRHQFEAARRPGNSNGQREGRTNDRDRNRNDNGHHGSARVAPGTTQTLTPATRDSRANSSWRQDRNDSRTGGQRNQNIGSSIQQPRLTDSTRPSLSPERSQGRGESQRRERSDNTQTNDARSDFRSGNHAYRMPDRSAEERSSNERNAQSGRRDSERSAREPGGTANGTIRMQRQERAYSRPEPQSRPQSQPRMENRSPSSERPPMQHGRMIPQGSSDGGGGGRGEGRGGDRDNGGGRHRDRNNR